MTPDRRARSVTSMPSLPTQYSTFHLGPFLFGVEVLQVQEVMRYQEMTPVPLASPAVRGLINLRGQIVTAIDLRRRMGLAARTDGVQPMNVVVRTGDGAVSLLVDEIADVVEVDPLQYEPTPSTVHGHAAGLVTGVYKLPGRLLVILDVERVIALDETVPDLAA
jgi:purine-binding chemotaxis protein CheW